MTRPDFLACCFVKDFNKLIYLSFYFCNHPVKIPGIVFTSIPKHVDALDLIH